MNGRRILLPVLSLLSSTLGRTTGNFSLPNPSGPHPVGITDLEVVDHNRSDPFTPSQPRALMISFIYPTSPESASSIPVAPQFSTLTATDFDNETDLPAGTASRILTRAHYNAPLARPDLPVLLFSHGNSQRREEYVAGISELASYGWNIISISHPGDAAFVEFPDGRTVANEGFGPPHHNFEGVEIRVADVLFLIDALADRTVTSKIPGLDGPDTTLNLTRIGAFGHSYGGATAGQSLLNASSVAAAANLDGTQYSALQWEGTDKPYLLMDTSVHNRTCGCDSSWAPMWPHLRGFKREVSLQGGQHHSYTDYAVWKDVEGLGELFPPAYRDPGVVGTLKGPRMLEFQARFLDAFFGWFLKGVESEENMRLLDGKSDAFPEAIVSW